MTNMQTTNTSNDVVTKLTGTLASRDAMRLTQLKLAASLVAAERSAIDGEQKRLAKKYGAASPQAVAAANRLTQLDQESAALTADITRTSSPVPAVEAGSFLVCGKIFDAQGKGVSGAKLTAAETSGAELASGTSNVQGAFELRVPLAAQKKAGKKEDVAPVAEVPVSFQLVITGENLDQPYTYPETFTAAAGRLTYREITLPGSR
jgi:hypothetical protein